MLVYGALVGGFLAGAATAQLLVGPAFRNQRNVQSLHTLPAIEVPGHEQQLSLSDSGFSMGEASSSSELPPYKAGGFTLTPQSNATCATYGESQWTGTIDVSDERRLFFWYFDSRNDPENDPIVIWINGGPGGTSMMGMFVEMGPCWLEVNATETTPNEWAWNNNASLLFIDQPAGVGFSSIAEGSPLPAADEDGSQDFQVFLKTFFSKVFPDKAHLPIHLAGESYGGHYVPTYTKHILDSRRYGSDTAFWGNITSIILVNAILDFTSVSIGQYELLCSEFREGHGAQGGIVLNATECEAIRLAVPECERLGRTCDLTRDGRGCYSGIDFFHLPCNDFPRCTEPNKGNFTDYLNQPHIKSALNFPPSFTFDPINMELNSLYTDSRTVFRPMSSEVAAILDTYRDAPKLGDIRLLVLQGNDDYACNTPGNMWVYDRLLWSGHADYRMTKFRELEDKDEVGVSGFWKATRDGRLAFVALDGAGHTVPGDAREASERVLQKWIRGDWHM